MELFTTNPRSRRLPGDGGLLAAIHLLILPDAALIEAEII